MLIFACKDAGVDCSFVALGESIEEVKEAAFFHAELVHKEIIQAMTPEQLQELAKTVEARIQSA